MAYSRQSSQRSLRQRRPTVLWFNLALLAAGLFAFRSPARDFSEAEAAAPNRASEETVLCRRNLERISTAIQAFANDHKDLPNWLSDLVPQYLADPNSLICPVCRRTGEAALSRLADPVGASSYFYELCPVPLGSLAPQARNFTWRDWKRRQMTLAGPVVPMVRCFHHESVLNLALDGSIYESPAAWEGLFTNQVAAAELAPDRLLAKERSPAKAPPPSTPAPIPWDPTKPLRVVTWSLPTASPAGATNPAPSADLETTRGGTNSSISRLAALAPDVIILQRVRDWQACAEVANSLKPARYFVAACSLFRNPQSGQAADEQVAILSKYKTSFRWVQAWQEGGSAAGIRGGFVFATLQIESRTIGLFAVQVGNELGDVAQGLQNSASARAKAHCIEQWLREVDSFRNWTTNRLGAVLIAGSVIGGSAVAQTMAEGKLVQAFLEAPFEQPILLPIGNSPAEPSSARLAANPDTLPCLILTRDFSAYDLAVEPVTPAPSAPPVAGPRVTGSDSSSAGTNASPAPVALTSEKSLAETASRSPARTDSKVHGPRPTALALAGHRVSADPAPLWQAGLLATAAAGLAVLWLVVRSRAAVPGTLPPARSIENEAATTSQVWRQRALAAERRAEQAWTALRAGLVPQLRDWLQQKLVRKLISDRAALLETQQAAALKAAAVEERLTEHEADTQKQQQAAAVRIDELTRQLNEAKAETRVLLEAQIAQLKAQGEPPSPASPA